MVGNDIIDRNETKRSTNWERRGFLEKMFTLQEQSMIGDSDDPFTLVWRLWSMKESAYKIYLQAGGKTFYNPKKIECTVDDLNGEVLIDSMCLNTNTLINDVCIFTTARIDETEVKSGFFKLVHSDNKWQSNVVRQKLIKEFAECNGLDCHELLVRKNENGVPALYYRGINLGISISLTHHGKFGGYSFLIYPSYGTSV